MANFSNLEISLTKLSNTFVDVNSKRELWKNQTKPLVLNTFKQIMNRYPNWNFYFDTNESEFTNLDWIALNIPDFSSGLFHKNTGQEIPIQGGQLAFSQMISGDIFISIQYPYMGHPYSEKGLREPIDGVHLGKLEPRNITADKVISYMNTFIRHIIAWVKEEV